MKLTKLSFSDNHTAVEYNGMMFDLKTCFFLVSIDYDLVNQEINMRWIKGFGDKVTKELPDELLFEFSGVSFLKAQQRDLSQPYPMDEFLAYMGFMDSSKIEDFSDDFNSQADNSDSHLSMTFNSDFAIKFTAETMSLTTKLINPAAL